MTKISLQSVSFASASADGRSGAAFTVSRPGRQSARRVTTKLNRPGSGSPARASNVFRPMTTGIPHVVFLKNFISLGKCQSNLLSLPIALLVLAATMRLMIMVKSLNGDGRFYRRVRLVILQGKVFKLKAKDIFYSRVECHHGKGKRLTAKL